MQKVFHTKDGVVIRELTDEEVLRFAGEGDVQAKVHMSKKALMKCKTDSERLSLIAEFLGLKERVMTKGK